MAAWWSVPSFKYYYFVPYNLFRLFLVHKISTYAFLYENRKRKRKKEFWIARPGGGGGFWPGRAWVRGTAAKRAQTSHEERGRCDGRRGCGPTCQREERG
jgi:hypothetical protein